MTDRSLSAADRTSFSAQGKAKLWCQGHIDLADLIDQTGR